MGSDDSSWTCHVKFIHSTNAREVIRPVEVVTKDELVVRNLDLEQDESQLTISWHIELSINVDQFVPTGLSYESYHEPEIMAVYLQSGFTAGETCIQFTGAHFNRCRSAQVYIRFVNTNEDEDVDGIIVIATRETDSRLTCLAPALALGHYCLSLAFA